MTSKDQQQPSLPSPPFYNVPNLNNLRDAALFPLTTSSGQKIRRGVLFRSAEVSKLDLDGWKAVREIGVGHVFDLRSKPEVDKGWAGIVGASPTGTSDIQPNWLSAMAKTGIQRTWTPVFEESDYSPERLAERYSKYMDESVEGFVHAYKDILRNAGKAFREILMYLIGVPADTNGEKSTGLGALIHCTAGKDRTGMFFAVLLSFLGVPPQQIADEYQLTENGLWHIRKEVVARLLQTPGFVKYVSAQIEGSGITPADVAAALQGRGSEAGKQIPPEVLERGRAAALRMIGARRESMLAALEMLEMEFGGAERYLRESCGLGDGELAALRRNLVIGEEQ
ncbi:hypothetical protein NX059_005581 [Plenodomus lindquistii]|nr:hypothetical protein NX059_005581 [Plenodomus lindquistii]